MSLYPSQYSCVIPCLRPLLLYENGGYPDFLDTLSYSDLSRTSDFLPGEYSFHWCLTSVLVVTSCHPLLPHLSILIYGIGGKVRERLRRDRLGWSSVCSFFGLTVTKYGPTSCWSCITMSTRECECVQNTHFCKTW